MWLKSVPQNSMKQVSKCLFLALPVLISSQCLAETENPRAYSNILIVGPDAEIYANEIKTHIIKKNVYGLNIITNDNNILAENKTTLYIYNDYPPNPIPNGDPELTRRILYFVNYVEQSFWNPYGFQYDKPSCASKLYVDENNLYNYIIVVDANVEGLECRTKVYESILSGYK